MSEVNDAIAAVEAGATMRDACLAAGVSPEDVRDEVFAERGPEGGRQFMRDHVLPGNLCRQIGFVAERVRRVPLTATGRARVRAEVENLLVLLSVDDDDEG